MSNLIPGNHKHLTPADRQFIEGSLNSQRSFRDIAKYLCKDPSTISKEVFRHRIANTWNRGSFNNPYNFCVRRYKCRKQNACRKLAICGTLCRSCHICNNVCPDFERESCSRIERAPYVCNGCNKPRKKKNTAITNRAIFTGRSLRTSHSGIYERQLTMWTTRRAES